MRFLQSSSKISQVRILAVDPGLTRCGVGVIETGVGRRVTFLDVFVIQTAPAMPLTERLFRIHEQLRTALAKHEPDLVALERVFAQHSLDIAFEQFPFLREPGFDKHEEFCFNL